MYSVKQCLLFASKMPTKNTLKLKFTVSKQHNTAIIGLMQMQCCFLEE